MPIKISRNFKSSRHIPRPALLTLSLLLSPLHDYFKQAIKQEDLNLIELLLARSKAAPTPGIKASFNPIIYAIKRDKTNATKFLARNYPELLHLPDKKNADNTLLHLCILRRNEPLFRYLLTRAPKLVHVANNLSQTPLIYACALDARAFVELIAARHPECLDSQQKVLEAVHACESRPGTRSSDQVLHFLRPRLTPPPPAYTDAECALLLLVAKTRCGDHVCLDDLFGVAPASTWLTWAVGDSQMLLDQLDLLCSERPRPWTLAGIIATVSAFIALIVAWWFYKLHRHT